MRPSLITARASIMPARASRSAARAPRPVPRAARIEAGAFRIAPVPAAVLGLALTLVGTTARAEAPLWTVVPAQSSVSFVGTQQGEKFTGVFGAFTARIRFAPAELASSRLESTLQMGSVTTMSEERDDTLVTSQWLDSVQFPTATFGTVAVRAAAAGAAGTAGAAGAAGFTADADLTIKDRTKRIVFPFSWQARPGGAVLDARVTIDRLDFGVGAGEWADESIVGRKVEVIVHLLLAPTAGR
jgi:polyisoprenoid-binding protein YceI